LKYRHPYKELGGDYLDQRRKDKITRSDIKRLNHFGYEVILKEAASAINKNSDYRIWKKLVDDWWNKTPFLKLTEASPKNKEMSP